nr:YafY family protein [Paenibacillus oenotherae]
MLSILWLLKTGRRMTAREIADTLEIHIRTVYRYIDALCASGVPIISDAGHNGGYSLLRQFNESPLMFDADEQKALVHAAIFARQAGYPFGEALSGAVAKLKIYTNEDQLEKINRHESGLDVINPPANTALAPVLQTLEVSAAEGSTLAMTYAGRRDSLTAREIDPYGLVYWKGTWYIVAYCRLRREIRSFRVDRIASLNRTEAVFERPADFSAREFFLGKLLPHTDNALITVRISGQEQAINGLCEHWLFGHALVERDRTEARFELDQAMLLTFVPYFLLPYGRAIVIKEPSQLHERMVAVLSEMLDYYTTSAPDKNAAVQ